MPWLSERGGRFANTRLGPASAPRSRWSNGGVYAPSPRGEVPHRAVVPGPHFEGVLHDRFHNVERFLGEGLAYDGAGLDMVRVYTVM